MKNRENLNAIYSELKVLGLVSNQYQFSALCGKTGSWFSTIKSRSFPITADAYLTLSFNIKSIAASIIDASTHYNALALSERLIKQAQEEVIKKALRFKACSFD